MGIEKMTFIDVRGSSAYLDEVLRRCLKCGIFQPEYASKLSEYSFGATALLHNPYAALLIKIKDIAARLEIPLEGAEPEAAGACDDFREDMTENAHTYLNGMRNEYPQLFYRKNKINDEIVSYSMALDMIEHIDEPLVNFDELRENKYLKIRFGRVPTQNIEKLEAYGGNPYEFYKLDSDNNNTWCFYVTAAEYKDEIDKMFESLSFESLKIPDYIHGTVPDAKAFLYEGLKKEREGLEAAGNEIQTYISKEKKDFLLLYSKVKFLHDAYDLRKYVISIKDDFHLVGYVLKRREADFTGIFLDLAGKVEVKTSPAGGDDRLAVPVQLRNNRFVKPFEMFVDMYGSPSYNDIDPTPFVAYTYSILFGMMFGDLGHGLCMFLLGLMVWKQKKQQLGLIMNRIGVTSMCFGFLYGSVFGFENALDWFYTGVLGLHEKPIEIMRPETTNTILAAAIGLGVAVILMVILFNIRIGIKHKDFDRAVLSPNGVAGLILYMAIISALVETLTKTQYLTEAGTILLIIIPLILVFFREPVTNFIAYKTKSDIINRDTALKHTMTFQDGSININELFSSQFVAARFGRIPVDGYNKLTFYKNEPFVIYPVKTEHDYVWCVYTAANVHKEEIDAIFRGLYFERLFIPDEYLDTNERAEEYIKRCIAAGGPPDDETRIEAAKYGVHTLKSKTAFEAIFPDGLGGFFTRTFFELFEVVLSFITNTMSFLRVGGFILVHAGMMAVVFTLSGMAGSGAGIFVIIVGNVFVMCLEGLIVGIQVLRLEFYEIFSRFFEAGGEPFKPVKLKV
ncbi:MAG: hypothetical protein FWG94_12765 [Oscillospiraceae bacterium]|nr:hypothetical protein [Oscillospiraceae bacterium]